MKSTGWQHWQTGAAALLVAALWAIARPYRGVRHDGLLYLGQVLHRLMPDRFVGDPFFDFGSQDQWSFFSALVAPLVAHFGVGGSELGVLLASHLLFMVGCWLLTREWPSWALRWASMVMVAVLPHTYGGLGAFSFAEPFLTARSLAEPFVLLALWQLQRGRLAAALAFVLIATAFHPLIALPGVAIGWCFLVQKDRRWAWALLALGVPVALGLMGLPPFDALWHRFDPGWWAAVRLSNANAFATEYRLLDLVPALFDALVLLLYAVNHKGETSARLVRATLAATCAFTLLWFLGADLLHDVLLTQLQLWRIYWPMHLLALLVLPRVLVHYSAKGWVGIWCVAAIGVAGLGAMSNWPTGWIALLWAVAALAAERWQAGVSVNTAKLAVYASLATIVLISFRVAATTMEAVRALPDRFADPGPALVVLGLPAAGLTIAALAAWLVSGNRLRQFAGVALVLALLGFGLVKFDQRSGWQQRLEASHLPRLFDDVLPANASVYWDGGLEAPWMLAQRGSFYSQDQGAGLLFNRGTAVEFLRRRRSLSELDLQRDLCFTYEALERPADARASECTPTVAVLATVCRADPHPDWIVIQEPLTASVPTRAEWHFDLPGPRPDRKSFYLYACSALH